MYDPIIIDRLVRFVTSLDGMGSKDQVAAAVQSVFHLRKTGKVYFCDAFAIRFCKADKKSASNTVLALKKLLPMDQRPFFVCLVGSTANYLQLANTTFLSRISHSSKNLTMENTVGSFNASDIQKSFGQLANAPENFQELFAIHSQIDVESNRRRLVEATANIQPRHKIPKLDDAMRSMILDAPRRTMAFLRSGYCQVLRNDLDCRTAAVAPEIAIAARMDNAKLRGQVIEYLITENPSPRKTALIQALHAGTPLPPLKLGNQLGDCYATYPGFRVATDIKSKMLFLSSAPKGYNIDKLLAFLAQPDSVYMIYLVGVDANGAVTGRLCSALDHRLTASSKTQHHWAGRNSSGTIQFDGHVLTHILAEPAKTAFDPGQAWEFLRHLMEP